MDLLNWLGQHWTVLVATAASIVAGATIMIRAIAPLTSSRKDDDAVTFLDKVYKWLSAIAINPPDLPATKAENAELAAKATELAKPSE